MSPAAAVRPASVGFTRPLTVVLFNAAGGEIGRKPLVDSILRDLRSELWLKECLMRGETDVPELRTSLEVEPRLRADDDCERLCARFSVGDDVRPTREYEVELVADAAIELVHEAIADGRLKAGDEYSWQVRPDRTPAPAPVAGLSLKAEVTAAPLEPATAPLAELQDRAEAVGTIHPQDVQVFFVREAWERGERFARRGADRTPPVETGAVYVGVLAQCPESRLVYVVVQDALELVDAEQAEYSLTLTGPTWARIRTIIQARRKQPRFAGLMPLGQAHGHNFLPAGGAPPCEHCAQQKVCTRTSVFLSTDDRRFMRSFMPGRPWQLSYIAGFNARKEHVSALYGLRDGRLAPRGYHLIDHFEPQS